MKYVLLFLFSIIVSISIAQTTKSWGGSISGNISKSVYHKNGYNIGIGAAIYTPKLYYFAINNHNLKYTALRKPSNYSSGLFTPDKSDDKVSVTTLSIGKLLETNNKQIRIGVEMGLSRLMFTESYFTQVVKISTGSGGFFDLDWNDILSATHSINTIDKIIIGYDMKAKVDVPLNNSIGFSIGYWHNFNKYKPIGMLELALSVGGNLLQK